jgi:hypothetical protein
MMNPTMMTMVARDRVAGMQQAAAKPVGPGWLGDAQVQPVRTPRGRTLSIHRAAPRRAIGWFLISLGLHLALPRPGTSNQ